MMYWGDVEQMARTNDGYHLRFCDNYWLMVAKPDAPELREGYRFLIRMHAKGWQLDDELTHDVRIWSSYRELMKEINIFRSPLIDQAFPLGLGDYWRLGEVPAHRLQFKASCATVKAILGITIDT